MIFQKFSTGVSMLQLNVELRVFDGTFLLNKFVVPNLFVYL
jgi:hypothetical protein